MTSRKHVSIVPFFHLFIAALILMGNASAQIRVSVDGHAAAQRKMPAVGDTVRGIYIGSWVANAPESGEAFHGKPVLLEFWATWCKPCMHAVPHLNELQKEFGDRVQFVAISQERASTAAKTLKKHPMRAAVGVDTEQGTTHKVFGVHVIPRTFVLSADRVVLWTGHPTRLTAEKLQSLLE
ncbi:TlpA family protein disulfide reductase [bacterium]|nr:TlpA family protein disulfide reductase [bacterium]